MLGARNSGSWKRFTCLQAPALRSSHLHWGSLPSQRFSFCLSWSFLGLKGSKYRVWLQALLGYPFLTLIQHYTHSQASAKFTHLLEEDALNHLFTDVHWDHTQGWSNLQACVFTLWEQPCGSLTTTSYCQQHSSPHYNFTLLRWHVNN